MKKINEVTKRRKQEIENLLNSNTLTLNLSTGMGRFKKTLDLRKLGLKPTSKEGKKNFREYFSGSKLYFFPKAKESDFLALIGRVRRNIERKSLTGGIVTKATYKEIESKFEVARAEYFALVEAMINKYDVYFREFQEKLDLVLKELNLTEDERELLERELLIDFPTKEVFEKSFSFELIPSLAMQIVDVNSSVFANESDEKKQRIEELNLDKKVELFYDIAGGQLSDLFDYTNKLIVQEAEGDIKERSRTALNKKIQEVRDVNSFLKLDFVEQQLVKIEDKFVQKNQKVNIDKVMADIYVYCQEIGTDIDLEASSYDAETLSIIGSI